MQKMEQNPSSSREDRKTIEKNRRDYMKSLCLQLNSMVPHQASKEGISLPDQLEEAASYIKKLCSNIEKLKQKKENLLSSDKHHQDFTYYSDLMKPETSEVDFPKIEIYAKGSALEVIMITGLDYQFIFNETVRILHEEGVEVISANFTVLHGTVFHTIHSKVGEVEMDKVMRTTRISRISERLKNFVYGSRLVIVSM